MADKIPPPAPTTKKGTFKSALADLLVLLLMLSAAIFGGYYWGTHQKLAVVELVPPGTPGAREVQTSQAPTASQGAHITAVSAQPDATTGASSSSSSSNASGSDGNAQAATPETSSPDSSSKPKSHTSGKVKYWISSSGTRFVGYSISVTVNGQPVDNFFAPGKQVDITDLVKKGKNSIQFDAKALEDKFNQHKGDEHASMTVAVDRGPLIQESVKASDVLISYKRNAAESENYSDTKSFTVD